MIEVRRVYLITYSQADTTKVPSRERFAEIVLERFQSRNVCDLKSRAMGILSGAPSNRRCSFSCGD